MGGMRIDTDVEMTTRDGAVLRADVYRPDDDHPRPALLHRTPYDKASPNLVSVLVADPVALARAGYAVVVQDVRGRSASGGALDFGEQEHDDGYDAVEWAAAQEWCDGQVGVYGSSYHAISTYAALAAAPPHLCAALVMIGAADLATTVRPGGAFELGFLTYYSLGQAVGQVLRSDRAPSRRATWSPGSSLRSVTSARPWSAPRSATSTCSTTRSSRHGGAPGSRTRPATTSAGRWPVSSRCRTCRC